MRLLFATFAVLAASASVTAFAQEPKLAREGRGLLPRPPAETPVAPPTANQFQPDPSGGFSRTVFETDENPNFKIVIRDFSFPPDKQAHTVTLRSAAFLHLLSGPGEISIAKQRLALTPVARTSVPAGAPIELVNNGEYPVVVRAMVVEAK
jgi:quercetin dioxygenase-like cupin family protein